MENVINWFEIPATDFGRSVRFYKKILDIDIHETEMFGMKTGFMPTDGMNVSGALVQGEGYTPSTNGAIIYLNGGNDLQNILSRVEDAGGKVVLPKTQISPEMGYFAMFIDTEGNKMALHSKN